MLINPAQPLDTIQTILGELPPADLPAVLLPVRLETRFLTQASFPCLCIRIFPDDIHIDTHEPGLTPDEIRWGQHLWAQAWRAGGDPALETALQRELVQRFGPGRAAWIAQTLTPLNPEDRPQTAIPEGESLPVAPRYPTPAQRSAAWTRPPQVKALPQRWVAMGFRQGERVLSALSEPIAHPLHAGPDPQAAPVDNLDDQTVLPLDPGWRWMVDFEAAVEQGMALRIPLASVEEAERGYDRLLVVGLNTSLDGAASAAELQGLLTSHRYTDSLDFVPQGTPSNHTAEAPAGYSSLEPEQQTELLSRRRAAEMATDANGPVTAQALGISAGVFRHLPQAAAREQAEAEAMNTVLWPATWGYGLRYGLNGLLRDEQIAALRQHFCQFVRGRGPLPTCRIGRQPYGLLPVTSLDLWAAGAEQPGIALLLQLRHRWQQALAHVPRVGAADDANPSQTLADILGMQAIHVETVARLAFDGALYGVFDPPGLPTPSDADLRQRHSRLRQLLQAIGLDDIPTDIPFARLMLTDGQLQLQEWLGAFADHGENLAQPLMALQQASFTALRDNTLDNLGDFGQTPFYRLLRHGLLLAYAEAAYQLQVEQGHLAAGAVGDPGLVDILENPGETSLTPLRLLTQPAGPNQPALGDTIDSLRAEESAALQSLAAVRQGLAHLATVPAQQLDLLLRETLDLASHRLDAWITSLATARLQQLRQSQPQGAILGGYGWVENLRLEPDQPVLTPPAGVDASDRVPLFAQANNGGYVAAPSLTQAATAAILRAGYLNHGSQQATAPFAIDLSSERVRLAQWLLAGVRQGQSLGALLGYRFERGLKDRKLGQYIETFRKLAPLSDLYQALAARDAAAAAKDTLVADQAQELAQAQQELNNLKNRINFYQSDLDAILRAINQKEAQKQALDQKRDHYAKKIPPLQQKRQTLLQERQAISRELDNLASPGPIFGGGVNSRLRQQLIQRYNQKTSEINSVNNQIKGLEKTLKNLRTQQAALEKEIVQLRVKQNQTFSKLHQTHKDIEAQEQLLFTDLPQQHGQQLQAAEALLQQAQTAYDQALAAYRDKYLYPPTAEIKAIESLEVQHGVDGWVLMTLWQAGKIPFGQRGLPDENSPHGSALKAQLNQLVTVVDAVSDLVTAESVYQLAQGNELRAGATLDAIATADTPPPEPDIIRTPRSGIAHTHRLAVVLPATATPPNQWKVDSFQQRAPADPALNAWVATMLVDPVRVRIEVTYLDPATEAPLASGSARLAHFLLSPLDILYLVTPNDAGTGSALEAQIAYRLLRSRPHQVPRDALVRFSDQPAPDWAETDISLNTFLETARAVKDLVTAARPLDARDLTQPETEAQSGRIDLEDLQQRADTAVAHLSNAHRHLQLEIANARGAAPDLDRLRTAFSRLYYLGFPEAVPGSAQGDDDQARAVLLEQAVPLLKSVQQRLARLEQLASNRAVTSQPDRLVEYYVQRLQTVFGPEFRVLPQFQPIQLQPLQQAWSQSLALQGDNPLAAMAWLDQMAPVRPGCQRLQTSLTYAAALDATVEPPLTVGQLPYAPGDRWVALPQPDGAIASPRTALVALMPHSLPAKGPLVGLMIDEWVDTIPNPQETAGVAFHFNAPQAQAPQAILLAVPPPGQTQWRLDTLEAILQETLDLAQLRTVDNAALFAESDSLPELPALYLAHNAAGDTIATDLGPITTPISDA